MTTPALIIALIDGGEIDREEVAAHLRRLYEIAQGCEEMRRNVGSVKGLEAAATVDLALAAHRKAGGFER